MRKVTYTILSIVLAISFFFFYMNEGFAQKLAVIPIVGALVGVIIQILRDQATFERSQLLADAQNSFFMGATSHMANVAFDKHVTFCEEYVIEVREAIGTLFREGATPNALNHAFNLAGIQQKYKVWLTPLIEAELEKFEAALRLIGANSQLVRDASREASQTDIQEMYRTLAEVMGVAEWRGEQLTKDRAQSMLITRLRSILGIEELTSMRMNIVHRSQAQFDKGG